MSQLEIRKHRSDISGEEEEPLYYICKAGGYRPISAANVKTTRLSLKAAQAALERVEALLVTKQGSEHA